MQGFVRSGTVFVSQLDEVERQVIAEAVADVLALISSDGDQLDSAMNRLFPPMSLEDPFLAQELSTAAREPLILAKTAALRTILADMEMSRVVVDAADADRWLRGLTDVRLVLAERLELDGPEEAEELYRLALAAGTDKPPSDVDPQRLALAVLYSGLTWWQESLIEALHEGSAGH